MSAETTRPRWSDKLGGSESKPVASLQKWRFGPAGEGKKVAAYLGNRLSRLKREKRDWWRCGLHRKIDSEALRSFFGLPKLKALLLAIVGYQGSHC
jgi:hypothetical protein